MQLILLLFAMRARLRSDLFLFWAYCRLFGDNRALDCKKGDIEARNPDWGSVAGETTGIDAKS